MKICGIKINIYHKKSLYKVTLLDLILEKNSKAHSHLFSLSLSFFVCCCMEIVQKQLVTLLSNYTQQKDGKLIGLEKQKLAINQKIQEIIAKQTPSTKYQYIAQLQRLRKEEEELTQEINNLQDPILLKNLEYKIKKQLADSFYLQSYNNHQPTSNLNKPL